MTSTKHNTSENRCAAHKVPCWSCLYFICWQQFVLLSLKQVSKKYRKQTRYDAPETYLFQRKTIDSVAITIKLKISYPLPLKTAFGEQVTISLGFRVLNWVSWGNEWHKSGDKHIYPVVCQRLTVGNWSFLPKLNTKISCAKSRVRSRLLRIQNLWQTSPSNSSTKF